MFLEYLNIVLYDLLKIAALVVPVLIAVAMIVWVDRRVWGAVQLRKGPNVVGPFGLFQTFADALKYIFKEVIIPIRANKALETGTHCLRVSHQNFSSSPKRAGVSFSCTWTDRCTNSPSCQYSTHRVCSWSLLTSPSRLSSRVSSIIPLVVVIIADAAPVQGFAVPLLRPQHDRQGREQCV